MLFKVKLQVFHIAVGEVHKYLIKKKVTTLGSVQSQISTLVSNIPDLNNYLFRDYIGVIFTM
jgi:hypothetical protein